MASRGADRGGEARRAGDLVAALFGSSGTRALSAAQRAAQAWYAANGDRERKHTTGVWLRKAGRAGQDPVLVVEVDANWLAGELATNKDLYLSRLSFRGIRVSDVRFQVGQGPVGEKHGNVSRETLSGPHGVSRETRNGQQDVSRETLSSGAQTHSPSIASLTSANLSSEERARVERACANLPDGLRQSVSRAMCASLLRNRTHYT